MPTFGFHIRGVYMLKLMMLPRLADLGWLSVCAFCFFFFFHKSSLLPLSGSQGASDEVGVYGGQPHGALVVPVGQFGEDP